MLLTGISGGTNKRALGFISVRPLSFSPAKTTKRDTQLCVPSRFRNLSKGPAGCLAPAAQLSEGEAGEEGQSSFLFWLSFDGLESVSLNPRPGRRAQGSLPLKAAADLWVR